MKENKMNSLNFVIVSILYCFGEICKGQEVFISQHETKWNQSTCTLAQPNVTCRGDGSCIVENGLEFLTNAEYQDNGLWIGYAKTWISYAYVGCEKSNTGAQYSVSTLGECRRTTGCHTFGIRKSTTGLRCKCTSNDNKRKQTCGRKCEEADQYPCGGTADTDIFSYYTVENVPPSNNSQDIHQNCLLFYYKHKPGYDYYWKPCTSTAYPKILCSNKYFSDKKAKAELDDQSEGNWAQAVEICADKGKFPASIRSINNGKFTDKEKQEHWTGIIKKESIVSLRDMHDISTYPPLTYAYVEKINQTFYVRFANEVDTKKSLCAGGSSTGIVVGVVIAVTLLVVGVLAVMIKKRGMLRACFKNTATAKSSGQPDTGVSTSVENQQRVEYVNTVNNEMDKNTGKSIKGNAYEKLNITTGVDNYLSIEEINTDEHEYQNT